MGMFRRYHWENKFKKYLETLNTPESQKMLDFIERYKVQIITNNICTSYNVKVVNTTIPQILLKEINKFMDKKGYYPTVEIWDYMEKLKDKEG